MFNRGEVEIPDDAVLIRELRLLERRPSNLGRRFWRAVAKVVRAI